jgi:hypothetical protein
MKSPLIERRSQGDDKKDQVTPKKEWGKDAER